MLSVYLTLPRIVVLAICFMVGCLANVMAASGKPVENDSMSIVVHHQSATCGNIVESLWLPDQQKYESTFQAMFTGLMSDSRPQPAPVNFDSHAMLLVSMGQQRTGGYSVKLAAAKMGVANDRAKIQVQWTVKKPDMMAIQMLTNPCLLLEVPRGNYKFIDVVDQSGVTRQSIATDQGQ